MTTEAVVKLVEGLGLVSDETLPPPGSGGAGMGGSRVGGSGSKLDTRGLHMLNRMVDVLLHNLGRIQVGATPGGTRVPL